MADDLVLGGRRFGSRFILGSGKFSLDMTRRVIEEGGVEMATLAVRRAGAKGTHPARGARRRRSA